MAKISFVRKYKSFGGNLMADIIYESGRTSTVRYEDTPKTVLEWLEGREGKTQYDTTFKREETIYD